MDSDTTNLESSVLGQCINFWLLKFDRHGVFGMCCVDLSVESVDMADTATEIVCEHRLLATLIERGYNASRVDLPHSTYDIVVELAQPVYSTQHADIIRVQVKTISPSGSVRFTGGMRGGVDREYKSGVKSYTQNTKTSDVVVGVRSTRSNEDKEINFYFVPTLYIEQIKQKSISIRKIPGAKNNWELLEKCRDKDFVRQVFASDYF